MKHVVTVDQDCELITDGTHYTPKNVGAGVPFLTVKDVTDTDLDFTNCSHITDEDYRTARAGNSAPQKGDVLFSKDGTASVLITSTASTRPSASPSATSSLPSLTECSTTISFARSSSVNRGAGGWLVSLGRGLICGSECHARLV